MERDHLIWAVDVFSYLVETLPEPGQGCSYFDGGVAYVDICNRCRPVVYPCFADEALRMSASLWAIRGALCFSVRISRSILVMDPAVRLKTVDCRSCWLIYPPSRRLTRLVL